MRVAIRVYIPRRPRAKKKRRVVCSVVPLARGPAAAGATAAATALLTAAKGEACLSRLLE